MLRAAETARLAYGEPTQEAALREINFGDIQGWNWDDMPKEMRRRMIAFDGFVAPGGESHAQMQDRVVRFLNGLKTGAHLVFTHGGVIRMLRRLCGDDRFPGSCELTRLDWTNRRALALD